MSIMNDLKKFKQKYLSYLDAFRKYTVLDLGIGQKEEELNEDESLRLMSAQNLLLKETGEIIDVFFNELEAEQLSYEKVFSELLHLIVREQNWELFLLVKDLYDPKKVKKSIDGVVCEVIHQILATESLQTNYGEFTSEWNRGAFIEYLIHMLKADCNKGLVIETLQQITVKLEHDNIENTHALYFSESLLEQLDQSN